MKWFIELGAVRMGAAIQNVCANVDFDLLSLPGGSLIVLFLWLYAGAGSFIRRATRRGRAPGTTICGARACGVPLAPFPARQAP
jgi:hypothetical protein